MCNPRIHGPYVNPIQNIRGYLTTPQVDLTQDGDINDSHPGYTSGVELDISTWGSPLMEKTSLVVKLADGTTTRPVGVVKGLKVKTFGITYHI